MNNNLHKEIRIFVRHMQRTYKNKLAALAMFMIGVVVANLSGDGTFLVFVLMFGLPMFFAKKDWFYKPED